MNGYSRSILPPVLMLLSSLCNPITNKAKKKLKMRSTFSGSGCLHFSAESLVVKMEGLQDSDQQTGVVSTTQERKKRQIRVTNVLRMEFLGTRRGPTWRPVSAQPGQSAGCEWSVSGSRGIWTRSPCGTRLRPSPPKLKPCSHADARTTTKKENSHPITNISGIKRNKDWTGNSGHL